MADNRRLYNRSYIFINKLTRALLVLIILVSLVAAIIGSLIDNSIPMQYLQQVFLVLGVATFTYLLWNRISLRRQEKRYLNVVKIRKERVSEFERQGFKATFRSIGSSRYFAVDEHSGKWFLHDNFNHGDSTVLFDLSDIDRIETGLNAAFVPEKYVVLMMNGKKLGGRDAAEYFSREGVVIRLKDGTHEFINCFKTEHDVNIISEYLQKILDERQSE